VRASKRTGHRRIGLMGLLFEGRYLASPNYAQYDVARDGRFIMLKPTGGDPRRSPCS
jgi:hypothetical protein